MSRFFTYFSVLISAILLASCESFDFAGAFNGTSPHVDSRFDTSMSWNNSKGYPCLTLPSTYKFYLCTDTHVEPGKDSYLKRFVADYKSDAKCSFAIHLGDLVQGKGNFDLFKSDVSLNPEGYEVGKDTLFTVAGNHDLYFDQWGYYVRDWHTSSYIVETKSAETGKKLDLLIFLDSGSGTLGENQTSWLKYILQNNAPGHRHILVFTHTNLFQINFEQGATGNYPLEETYELSSLLADYGVEFVLMGHDHNWYDIVFGNVRYISVSALKDGFNDAEYMIFNIGSSISFSRIKM